MEVISLFAAGPIAVSSLSFCSTEEPGNWPLCQKKLPQTNDLHFSIRTMTSHLFPPKRTIKIRRP